MTTDWPIRRLSDIAEVRVSNVDKKTRATETPVRLCNYMDVYSNVYIRENMEFMDASATLSEIERFGLKYGDVVITKDLETPDDIGVPAVVAEPVERLVCGYHLALIRPHPNEIDPVYLMKQLSSTSTARYFALQASGSTRYGLPVAAIEAVPVPTPPKPEQRKIARILSTLDEIIEQSEALIAKQELINVGLMHDLLTRGIDKCGQLRSEQAHEFKESSLGRIPIDWWTPTIGELFDKRTERGRPGLPVMSVVMKQGLIERSSVDRRVESNLQAEGHALVLKGDIAYNMMRMWQGVLGRASFDCLVSPAYIVLKPRDTVDSVFAEWLFRERRSVLLFHRNSRGVVDDRLRLYPQDLFSIRVAIPRSLDEQSEIGTRLEATKSRLGNEVEILRQHRRLRVGLAQDLLTGSRRVVFSSATEDRALEGAL